ncbi:MAG TPA: NAD-dependent epimerase/dehydratase family protein [Actinomycetota bacterium]|jgi:UDP-sulfoquinovose synthase|nr:NAD-dependent epimerase/dehydratase family protein [Actinomycetota bacterium]
MRILILGGDGYLGWPTAMHFSNRGHEVHCVDNYLRRRAVREQRADSLVPIPDSLPARADAWEEVTGYSIGVTEGDICDWDVVEPIFREFEPEAIVHYGEMPSAPYSMKSREHAVFTQYNNVVGTMNVLWAIRDIVPDAHLVKLGTLGEYGTPGIDIEEGFIEIHHEGRSDVLPFPKMPGSLYHASKVHDSTNIHLACRIWGVRATDLHQGVVYGIETDEARMDDRFLTRFDYDDAFGTALNRFCLQAVIGHPLTVYGRGGQTRGLINIVDTVQCVELATLNPADPGEYRVFNQFTERFSLLDLAELVQRAGREYGLTVRVDHLENPRVEAEEHYYNPKHTKLLDLGLKPHTLSETLIESMFGVIERYRDRIVTDVIMPKTTWAPRTRETSSR